MAGRPTPGYGPLLARQAGLTDVVMQGNFIRFSPVDLLESAQLRLKRLHPGSVIKQTAGLMLVPKPRSRQIGGPPVKDRELLQWCTDVVGNVIYGTMFTNYFAGQAKPVAEQAGDILDVVFHGILTDAERARRRSREVLECVLDGSITGRPYCELPRGAPADAPPA